MSETRVKICGLTRREDVRLAEAAGADFLGTVMVPRSPRAVGLEAARRLFDGVKADTVCVVADLGFPELLQIAQTVNPSILQLHGEESTELIQEVRSQGSWKIWKAVPVRTPDDIRRAGERYGDHVDGFVLDAWDPRLLGGTGKQFPWDGVGPGAQGLPGGVLFVAAGGLGVRNVRDAVERLEPDVVDVSSGVESSPGVKDPELVKQFIRVAKDADSGGQG